MVLTINYKESELSFWVKVWNFRTVQESTARNFRLIEKEGESTLQRSELLIKDIEIINQVADIWGFIASSINYIEFGSTFAFSLEDKHGEKVFLKIYKKDGYVIKNYFNNSIDFLRMNCDIIYRLHSTHHLQQIPVVIKTNTNDYLYENNQLIFILSHYLEGKHPSYEPNDLRARELAIILSDLHAVPISEYPDVMHDHFNIDVALGLESWLEYSGKSEDHIIPMLNKLSENKEFLKHAIIVLKQLQQRFVNHKMKLVLTHGDAHHFNVLQNQSNMFLIDWDDIRVGPRERDLWHYEFAPLMPEYLKLNPTYAVNHDLCMYYQLNRFLEDLRIDIEETPATKEQAEHHVKFFCNHWGWVECYKRVVAL